MLLDFFSARFYSLSAVFIAYVSSNLVDHSKFLI